MRIYSAESMEVLRARRLLKEWTADGLLGEEQQGLLEQETVPDLRTTNIFLRGVLFFFTVIVVAAGTGLFFTIFFRRETASAEGILFLLLALACYAGAEMAVAQARLYHYGIEEALACCSVGFLFAGLELSMDVPSFASSPSNCFVRGICGMLALWMWQRFGYWYMFLAAMIFGALLPGPLSLSSAGQHGISVCIYVVGLVGIVEVSKGYRFDHLRTTYSVAEALLWSGIYLGINLKISASTMLLYWRDPMGGGNSLEFPPTFYWSTWVLTWCLPPIILARGIRNRDRFVIGVGLATAILTFVTNKPYLGWQRHTWDPMLLGVFLTGVVLWMQRWLARGPGGVREGFTAARISGKDKSWMNVGSGALGLVMPHSITPGAQAHDEGPSIGGASGGGGATRDF